MKKNLLLFFLFTALFFKFSYSQAPLATTNPNFVHDKLEELSAKSLHTIILPDSVTQLLINYARNKNLEYQLVLRNSYMFKVLYNENLSIDDRLFACKYYILANSDLYQYSPLFFLKELQASLIARK